MFDWPRFLSVYSVEYVESGPNISRGEVGVKCPWCGSSDSGQHMAINLSGRGWICRRNQNHSGRSPHKLIQALIGCSYGEAAKIVGADTILLGYEDQFVSQLNTMLGTGLKEEARKEPPLEFPEDIRPITTGFGLQNFFVEYLRGRKYTEQQALLLSHRYGFRYATVGPFAYRLIIPVYMREGLVNWTGRAISKTEELRYRTLSADQVKADRDGLPRAKLSVERTLLNFKELSSKGGDILIVDEGPLDAYRLDFFGEKQSIRATSLFGKNLSEYQVLLLEELSPLYKHKFLLLDPDANLDMLGHWSRLQYLGFKAPLIEIGAKDHAAMTEEQVGHLFSCLRQSQ